MALIKEAQVFKNDNLVTDKQKQFGLYNDGKSKEITKDGWIALVGCFSNQTLASNELGVSKKWLQKMTNRHKYGWSSDATPVGQRPEAKSGLIKLLEERYTREELDALAKGRSTPQINSCRKLVDFAGEVVTIGYYTDTHIGAKTFNENWFASMWAEFKRQKIDMTIHSGDVFEGMSTRQGHQFECDYVGYQSQMGYALKIYRKYAMQGISQNFIDGNHDRWFSKAIGADIVPEFCNQLGYTFLGQDEGDLILNKWGITIKPWHGEDGNSYATSYRIQKIVEAFSGGEKPNILLTGHTHKAMYALIRNVHCISGGAMSRQSKWMRGKRIENHAGFWVIKMGLGKNDVKWVEPRFYSFYK